ncbi:hypothetical protein ACFWY9_21620 [Amycolatopsis sp. NPDC059027]|uniref:hypothetical protein n=1 Tax=unclassified Amycolatopsis TaxID=2618356 RepID=UPI00367248C9
MSIRSLRTLTQRYFAFGFSYDGNTEEPDREHTALVKTIETGQADTVAELTATHIRTAHDEITRRLLERGFSDTPVLPTRPRPHRLEMTRSAKLRHPDHRRTLLA